MFSTALGLLLLSLVSGHALIISGGDLAHIDITSGTVTPSVGPLNTYPNDVVIHNGYAFVVNSGVDDGALQRFEMETWTLTEMTLGTGWNCWAALPVTGGNLAVSATLNGSIEIVDPENLQIVSSISGVTPNPEWMAAEGNLIYAACGGWGTGNSVIEADLSTGAVTRTLTADTNCQSLVLHGDEAFVTCSGTYGANEGCVVVIDLTTGNATDTLSTGGFPGYSVGMGDILYLSDPWGAGVYSIDMSTKTVRNDSGNPFCTGGNGMAVDENGNLWITDGMAGEVRVYDPSENLQKTYTVASPGAIAVTGGYNGTAAGDITVEPTISVYPNPAFSSLNVRNAAPGETVAIYDVTGRVAGSAAADSDGTCTIDVTGLRPGLYSAVSGSSAARFAVTAR
ncbi:hypothetical protein CSA37_04245 [Candidatus Fermentibacteria bacterium]|nr:MAG: hypothetical protein CSA37_04245 [Candidatus Fermentibacteria bacterium]